MDKAFILSSIIDEYQKVIDNLKASVERYKHESDIDEDNTLDQKIMPDKQKPKIYNFALKKC